MTRSSATVENGLHFRVTFERTVKFWINLSALEEWHGRNGGNQNSPPYSYAAKFQVSKEEARELTLGNF
jgi:hypothetical protein